MTTDVSWMTTKAKAVERFGVKIVEEAESYYETDFDKHFWSDLDEYERLGYIRRAKYSMERTHMKTMFIVGKITTRPYQIEAFKKEMTSKGIFVFDDQQAATECAESMTKRLGGEWTVFEVEPVTTTKMVTILHREQPNGDLHELTHP